MERKRIQLLLEIAILGAISFVLDKIGFSMPQGGSITFPCYQSLSWHLDGELLGGMLTGFISGLLQLITGGYVFNAIQARLIIS